ncbi:hypothetical protein GQR58_023687 [Nymphon striatum]|nr:hypothetical protein GQR58_023687 [Nymphon striatum]
MVIKYSTFKISASIVLLNQRYRHVRLRNLQNQPLELSSLFIFSESEEDGLDLTERMNHSSEDIANRTNFTPHHSSTSNECEKNEEVQELLYFDKNYKNHYYKYILFQLRLIFVSGHQIHFYCAILNKLYILKKVIGVQFATKSTTLKNMKDYNRYRLMQTRNLSSVGGRYNDIQKEQVGATMAEGSLLKLGMLGTQLCQSSGNVLQSMSRCIEVGKLRRRKKQQNPQLRISYLQYLITLFCPPLYMSKVVALSKGHKLDSECIDDYILIEEVYKGWGKKDCDKVTSHRILDIDERPLEAQAQWKGEGKLILKKTGDDPSSRAWMTTIRSTALKNKVNIYFSSYIVYFCHKCSPNYISQ